MPFDHYIFLTSITGPNFTEFAWMVALLIILMHLTGLSAKVSDAEDEVKVYGAGQSFWSRCPLINSLMQLMAQRRI